MVLTLTWMPWIKFLSGRTCILLWILYGNMVDFPFIVSLYVSDLPNVTISTRTSTSPRWILYGNMVDFSFIVSLYVSDLPNVTISTSPRPAAAAGTVLVYPWRVTCVQYSTSSTGSFQH